MDLIKQFGKVAVLYGGKSAERSVSLNSGKGVLQALLDRGVDAHGIDVGDNIIQVLQQGKFDRAFNVLHGPGGEDGSMQAVLDFLKIPYCGSGVAASSLAMDKVRAKWVWQANNIPTPKFMLLEHENDLLQVKERFQLPVAVKPVHEGSSVAVFKVKTFDELLPAYRAVSQLNDDVMVEQWIEGEEFTVPFLADEILPSIKITPAREFYDYQAKYIEKTTVYSCPSGLSMEKELELQGIAKKAFHALGCKGWGRVDAMQDKQGNFWVLEINTLPGMTETSLLPKAAKVTGLEYPDLVVKILATSLAP